MVGPSGGWSGFTSLDPQSEKYKRIQLVISSADFEHLEKRGIEARRRYQTDLPSEVSCRINSTTFASGFNNMVLELAFSDNVYWIARIPYRAIDDETRTSLLSEIATIRTIRKLTRIPVPEIFEFEMSVDQPFGFPYVLMEYLGGRTLDNMMARSIPEQYHPKVARQFANVFTELQKLTFDRIGRLWCGEKADQPPQIIPMSWHYSPGPLETSLEYFYNQRHGENREIIALQPDDPDWRTACWVLNTALTQIIVEDKIRGPFPLCHLDLHYGNLLFDDEYNLTGVIDWSNAQAAPLEQLSLSPEFVGFPGLSDEENRPIVEFKKLVIQSIKKTEEGQEKEKPASLNGQQIDTGTRPNCTTLSTYMASKSNEIAYRQYVASPRGSLWAGKMVAMLIFGSDITWDQLRGIYSAMPLL